ncbi:MAG: NAD(P)-binding domain-containing protein [Candidatus Omnitrophica bacterium]|nr:NAD(P)-binding domain-containing protein [Candidatus Omnitrophota bacterium]
MPDKDLIHIKVSRILPAEKWKVIRLITKVKDFPAFVPSIKEVSVLKKTKHKLFTKWRVQINQIPISWTEEDTLVLKENYIAFKAIGGDLSLFKGEWRFSKHPQGTQVDVNVDLKVGIPAITEFADSYVKQMLTLNFEAILSSVERRLISTKYASYQKGDTNKIAGFGIIGHLYNFNHLDKCLKMLNPSFKMPSREFIGQLFNITPSFKLYDIVDFKSRTGQSVNGCFIVATFIPDMMERDIWSIFSKVVRGCKIAEKHGVGIVSLGGFTSIVAERIGIQITEEVDVPVTSGNTFTAAMVIDGVVKASMLLEIDLGAAKVAIIGGTGDIGSGCARVLVSKVNQLIITGRTKSNLKRLGKELSKERKAKIIATTDNEKAVKDADIIIAAASATSSILQIDWFKPGAIICDVGYPKNISYSQTNREDILIFSGGLTKAPTPIKFPIDIGLPAADTIYGCFAESIILALEKRFEKFSFGRGNITAAKIEEIRNLGIKHGFEVSDFYWGNRLVDNSTINCIKKAGYRSKNGIKC